MDLALNNLQWFICHKTKPKVGYSKESQPITQLLGIKNSLCYECYWFIFCLFMLS